MLKRYLRSTYDMSPEDYRKRRPCPPASILSVSRLARSFSTILSGRLRPATSCVRSSGAAGRVGDFLRRLNSGRRIDDSRLC
jgi:hypothetical protein